jgi:hypothetical protein
MEDFIMASKIVRNADIGYKMLVEELGGENQAKWAINMAEQVSAVLMPDHIKESLVQQGLNNDPQFVIALARAGGYHSANRQGLGKAKTLWEGGDKYTVSAAFQEMTETYKSIMYDLGERATAENDGFDPMPRDYTQPRDDSGRRIEQVRKIQSAASQSEEDFEGYDFGTLDREVETDQGEDTGNDDGEAKSQVQRDADGNAQLNFDSPSSEGGDK